MSRTCSWHFMSVNCNDYTLNFHKLVLSLAVDAAVELITGKQLEMTSEGNGPVENHAVANKSLKRPNADSDEEEDKGSIAPPIHDIYRARQQKRIRWGDPKAHKHTRTWTSQRTIEPEPTRVSQLAEAVLTPASSLVYCEPALQLRRSQWTRTKRVPQCRLVFQRAFRLIARDHKSISYPSSLISFWFSAFKVSFF